MDFTSQPGLRGPSAFKVSTVNRVEAGATRLYRGQKSKVSRENIVSATWISS